MTTVEQIHQEVDTAQERLLQEAQAIINSNSHDFSKAERLEALGFTATQEVVKSKESQTILVTGKAQAKTIQHYTTTYPFLKFLTEAELDRICNKYSLVYAGVGAYTKTVPEKNLKEIEDAQPINAEDFEGDIYQFTGDKRFHEFMTHLGYPDLRIDAKEYIKLVEKFYGHCPPEWERPQHSNTGLYVIHERTHVGERYYREIEVIDRSGLFIAAPKDHFNLEGLKKHKKGFFESITVSMPKDPIVFRYCKGGIQVLTKWGKEAEDEAFVVPNNN